MHIHTQGRPQIADSLVPIIEALETAEIRVYISMRDIDPPCVFVPLPELAFRFKTGGFDAQHTIVAIASNTGDRVAIEQLSELVSAVQLALGEAAQTARPIEVVLADNTAVLLSMELTFNSTITPIPVPPIKEEAP